MTKTEVLDALERFKEHVNANPEKVAELERIKGAVSRMGAAVLVEEDRRVEVRDPHEHDQVVVNTVAGAKRKK